MHQKRNAIGPSLCEYELHLNNRTVETQVNTFKILEAILDGKLNCKAHIKEQLKKACAKASALRIDYASLIRRM